jgi:predicted phage terminase large subunit-like protein
VIDVSLPVVETGIFAFGARKQVKTTGKPYYQNWLKKVSPSWIWNWNYQVYIQQYLDKITDGEIKRLMLFVPPRHGKSEMVTVRYPVYRLKRDPGIRVIFGAYNQTLAEKFSRKSRKIARDQLSLSRERTAAEDWETEAGGGVRAVGVGGGITGQGGDLIIIDDPVKSRKEANSKTYRDTVYDWYTDDLYTRLEPNAAIILIMTRWHEDDLAGRILASEDGPNWTVINLPAEAEKDDPLSREPGEALCPDRYPLSELIKIKRVLGKSYYALYQQRPMEQEGDKFKRSWFELISKLPAAFDATVRYWDKASTKDGGDYTAGVLMGRLGETYYVLDLVRGQWSTGERDQKIRETAIADRERWGHVVTVFEQEPGSSGVDAARSMAKILDGFTVKTDKVTGDKALRADPFASQAEFGFVKVYRGHWFDDWIDEITSFPNGAHDDVVDASSGAYNQIAVFATWNDVQDLGHVEDYRSPWA